jgi:hypothetical protein
MYRTLILIFILIVALARAQEAPLYRIERASSPITLDARLDEPSWQAARPVGDFLFNWFASGEKEPTEAWMLWDDENLYVSWRARDKHISAYVTERHGPVSRDDTAEIFISPNPKQANNYYTFEINVIGAMLNRCRTDWWTGPPTWEPEGVRIGHSIPGPTKNESPDDTAWVVEMAIPLRNFSHDAANTPPRAADVWRLNLNRCGGQTNAQASSWSPIGTERPAFHSPDFFGYVTFSDQRVR